MNLRPVFRLFYAFAYTAGGRAGGRKAGGTGGHVLLNCAAAKSLTAFAARRWNPWARSMKLRSCKKSLAEFAARRRQRKCNHFLSRHVRERKYLSGCKCGICAPSAREFCAQQTASLLSENPIGVFRQAKKSAAHRAADFSMPKFSLPDPRPWTTGRGRYQTPRPPWRRRHRAGPARSCPRAPGRRHRVRCGRHPS